MIIRCAGKLKNGEPCNRIIFDGSPGYDMTGQPRSIVIKCPRCYSYNLITCHIEETVVVKDLGKKKLIIN
jgi:phage FluMu protein Com